MKYTISEMASLLGVTTHMLRHYEKIGIIAPEVNKENGYRYYTVLDTRRFNLSRLLFSCGIPLEQCAELMGNEPLEEADALIAERQTALALEARRIQYAIDYLRDYREELPMIEADVGKVRIEHKPDMWRLMLSHVEKARSDKALQSEKQRWMACFPAVRWVSRIPYEVMKQFSTGPIEYDFGLMCVAEQGRALAAVAALENGASVIVVEKTAMLGGNTVVCGGVLNAADTEWASQFDVQTGEIAILESFRDMNVEDFPEEYQADFLTLKGQIEEYLAGDTTRHFDSIELHTIMEDF